MEISTIVNTDANPVKVSSVKRQDTILKVRNKNINGNDTSYVGVKVDVSNYLFVYAVISTDASHNFKLYMYPKHADKTPAVSSYGYETIIDYTGTTARTDWLETYAPTINLELENNDSASHVYDVTVYGVR